MHFNLERIRTQFPALQQHHHGQPVRFFDGPGGAQVPQVVLDAMVDYLGKYNSNLGGHFFSSHVTVDIMQRAREAAQALLNTPSPNSVVFGANMTSLTFTLSRSISRDWSPGDEIIVTTLDHYANVSPWLLAAQDKGVVVHHVNVDKQTGGLDMAHLASLITARTRLVAATYASNTTGTIVDMAQVVQLAKAVNAQVFVDAVHYAPHHLIDVQRLGCDFLLCSAYKFFGPHLGVAYVAEPWLSELTPYKVEPAPAQGPGRFETGTQNFEALSGLIATVNYLAHLGAPNAPLRERLAQSFAEFNRHERALSDYFLSRLQQMPGVTLHGIAQADSELRTPTFALSFDSLEPAAVAKALGEANMCTWSGHFYALGLIEALGLQDQGGVLRIGCMHYNSEAELAALCDELQRLLS